MTNTAGRPGATAGSLIRITVSLGDRRLDIGVPTHTPLAEHMPGFVRHLGALDPTLVYGGYHLQRADGSSLSTDRTLVEQDVQDGDLLTLVAGALQPEAQIYDDVVEAVGDAVGRQQAPWTATDSARTALAASTAFLVIGAVLLALSADHGFGALVAGAGAALILTLAAVLSRLQQPVAGLVLALTATVFGAVCGLLLAPSGDLWGLPMAGAGAGAIVVGLLGAAAIARYRDFATIIGLAGIPIGIAGSIVAFTGAPTAAVYGLTIAIAGTLSNGAPWLALSSSRITVITPHSDQEIFLTPPPIDGPGTAARTAIGHRLLLVGRIALTLVAFIATPAVVGLGLPGALLCALTFVGLMTSSRRAWARSEVLAIMGTGLAGVLLTGITAALVQPEWRPGLVLILAIAAALLVGLTLLGTRTNLRVARIADAVDIFSLALLLPLGVIVAGIA